MAAATSRRLASSDGKGAAASARSGEKKDFRSSWRSSTSSGLWTAGRVVSPVGTERSHQPRCGRLEGWALGSTCHPAVDDPPKGCPRKCNSRRRRQICTTQRRVPTRLAEPSHRDRPAMTSIGPRHSRVRHERIWPGAMASRTPRCDHWRRRGRREVDERGLLGRVGHDCETRGK